jgi:hypothetical protein
MTDDWVGDGVVVAIFRISSLFVSLVRNGRYAGQNLGTDGTFPNFL